MTSDAERNPTVQVEMLAAYGDNTWDTVFLRVPVEALYPGAAEDNWEPNRETLLQWVEEHVGSKQPPYLNVVCWQLYSVPEPEEEDGS
jgi:hypothetical protein